jgi:hypothetical protein
VQEVFLSGRGPIIQAGLSRPFRAGEGLLLDLSTLEFATPLDVAGAAMLSNLATGDVTIVLPSQPRVGNYLAAMGFLDAVPPTAEIVGRRPGHRGVPAPSIPILKFSHPDEWDDLANRNILRYLQMHLGPAGAANVVEIIGELADNAGTHGASTAGYYVAGQFYTGRTSRMPKGMWIAVVDAGIGIRRHLAASGLHPVIASDAEAIQLAARPGITGTMPPRGYGLVDVRRFARRLGPGRVVIRSGDGAGLFALRPPAGRTAWYRTLVRGIPGTWVLVHAGQK